MIELSKEQAQAILDYLIHRPFGEVAAAVGWMQAALDADAQKESK